MCKFSTGDKLAIFVALPLVVIFMTIALGSLLASVFDLNSPKDGWDLVAVGKYTTEQDCYGRVNGEIGGKQFPSVGWMGTGYYDLNRQCIPSIACGKYPILREGVSYSIYKKNYGVITNYLFEAIDCK